jgi:thiamine-phosphate pyrophosphorylase
MKDARNVIGFNKILGVSTHNITQARAAQREGADYIGVGPLFPTATKDYEPPIGLACLKQAQRDIFIPFVAIGGVNLKNLDEVLEVGGRRVAICSAIISSNNVTQTTQLFRTRLDALSLI